MANGVYWVGQDNNVYAKDNTGAVKNYGGYVNGNNQGFDSKQISLQGYSKIADPNPGGNPNYLSSANILGQYGYTPQVYAPSLDLSGIYNQAGQTAAANVNPYYTKQLTDFQNQQTQSKALQQQQVDLNNANIQAQLQNTLSGNAIQQSRAAQDTTTNEQQIAQKADYQQQDQGTQFDEARIAQAKQLAGEGLTTSGLGTQQVVRSEAARNVQESRQAADTQQQVAAQELGKARTFEDIARSNTLAGQAKDQGLKQSALDWNKFVQQQGMDLTNKTQDLEGQRLAQLAQEQQTQYKLALQATIAKIANPAQRAAAYSTYL